MFLLKGPKSDEAAASPRATGRRPDGDGSRSCARRLQRASPEDAVSTRASVSQQGGLHPSLRASLGSQGSRATARLSRQQQRGAFAPPKWRHTGESSEGNEQRPTGPTPLRAGQSGRSSRGRRARLSAFNRGSAPARLRLQRRPITPATADRPVNTNVRCWDAALDRGSVSPEGKRWLTSTGRPSPMTTQRGAKQERRDTSEPSGDVLKGSAAVPGVCGTPPWLR